MNAITVQLPDVIAKARARLLVRAPFFGAIALSLAWVDAPEVRTMATDGRGIWFNQTWCDEQGVEKIIAVIAHEVLHVVNRHHLRRGERNTKLWNVAADLLINRLLAADDYQLPDTLLIDREGEFTGLTTETIYARLAERQDEQSGAGERTPPPSQHGGGSGGNAGKPDDAGNTDTADEWADRSARGAVAPAESWGEVRDLTTLAGKPLSPTERRQAEHDLEVRVRQATAAARRAGKFGGGLAQMIAVATDRVDWRDKFRIAFDGTLSAEVTWSRPNRRFIQHGLFLPGSRRVGAGRVAFILDTSGSISARELSVYTAAVIGILEETGPEQVALIQCDTEVRQVTYLGPGEAFTEIEVVGRGGTRFQPAFDWLSQSGFAANAIVYATDLASCEMPHDPGIPIIWLTPTQGKTMPFGDIVEVTL